MKRKLFFVIILLIVALRLGVWNFLKEEYRKYKAVHAYAHNDLDAPSDFFSSQLVDDPMNDELNYNAGVVQYKKKNYEQARESFARATQGDSLAIQEQAYFNGGNTNVQLNKLEEAVESYEKVLELNPDNEEAKHNLALVKEMLKKREEEQQKEEQKKEQGDQEQEEPQEKDDKDQSEQQEKEQKNQSKNEQGGSSDTKNEKDNQQSDDKQQSEKDQGNEQKGDPSKKNESSEPKKEESKEGDASSAQQGNTKEEKGNSMLEEQQQAAQAMEERLDEAQRALLQEMERQDKGEYKKMIRTQVQKEMPRHEGQKNW
jgi:hypothetical protein